MQNLDRLQLRSSFVLFVLSLSLSLSAVYQRNGGTQFTGLTVQQTAELGFGSRMRRTVEHGTKKIEKNTALVAISPIFQVLHGAGTLAGENEFHSYSGVACVSQLLKVEFH